MDLKQLFEKVNGVPCPCGKEHKVSIKVYSGIGAIKRLPEAMKFLGAESAFILCDKNTERVAGESVCSILSENGYKFTKHVFKDEKVLPNEHSVGSAIMSYDIKSDVIIAVGSGVINDIGKIVSKVSGAPLITVATAPSMDGYASDSSSMEKDGVKVSLPTKSADILIGDTDILKTAPDDMLRSGLGDMLAKYVSITEWRLSEIISGEYFCERVADIVKAALHRCVDNRDGLLRRETEAIEAVFEGLVITGIAMTYAGISRPASGVEHYISHIWDMRGMEFDLPTSLHGLQCAVGTLISARIYEQIKKTVPNKEKAVNYAHAFSVSEWNKALRSFLGSAAEAMIALEKKEGKYCPEKHGKRIDVIIGEWERILSVINAEMPSAGEIEEILDGIGAPKTPKALGIDGEILPMTFKASKDIRDKYVLSRLCWDLGIIDEIGIS